MNYKLETIIRAISHDSRTIIAGRYVADIENAYGGMDMVIEQPNGVFGYVSNRYFIIEERRPKRTALELELIELIELYREKGKSDEYILLNIKKVFENMRDPVKELKGDLDT